MVYQKRMDENNLHEFAQHNEHCQKVWGTTKVMPERGEFQRDRERIVNSKAFRRMVDKAQIFTSSKGDHYRTRMTHTMEVAQIARSIANSLGLNIDLTEAIALGHDLGHTPFGHQGERTLQDILARKIEVGLPNKEGNNIYGGFRHNFQSVRVLNCLEDKYIEHEGLDVSYQVLEGVLKHTTYHQKECECCSLPECPRYCCDLNAFLGNGDIQKLYTDIKYPTTLEAQVVAVADEIAQRSHDVDDAMSAGLLNYEQLKNLLNLEPMQPLREIIDASIEKINMAERAYVSKEQIICARIISDIINYLVNDVIVESRKRMKEFRADNFYQTEHRFSKQLVFFSESGSAACRRLEDFVNRIVISSSEIMRFDYNAANIIKTLFQIYYHDPRLLHTSTLRKITIEITQRVGSCIALDCGDPKEVQEEFRKIISGSGSEAPTENVHNSYWDKHVILVRNIVDYIAGMTDSYARNEYSSFTAF